MAVADDADASHLAEKAVVLRLPRVDRGLDLPGLLRGLFERDVQGVFLEGGPTLAGSFVRLGRIDRVVNYVAPAMLGAGKSGLGDAGIKTMADIRRLEVIHVSRSGPDLRIVVRPAR